MEQEQNKTSVRSTAMVLPLFAVACAAFAFLLLFSSGPGARLNAWTFRTGFAMIQSAGYIGLGCAVVALASSVISARKRHYRGIFVSLIALILALISFGIPLYWKVQAQSYPRIHDISTDLNNPPRFVAISTLRRAGVRYGGIDVATQQMKAYPELKTMVMAVPANEAYKIALLTARDLGWDIVAERPAEGTIEATDMTRWFGFKDDIVIRIVPAGDRSLLDIRSVSRVGISDVGTNAKRVRAFMAKIAPGHK
ncbi:DUF1499 domain-containing protein [Geomonas anaerohicana]|uniref:DUF1499 domain-containing protein n=1 Tax=Geomonas anaerohicana TaxID=2798583 RepID=A0ABS0YEI8_9BACT|nr:DUF1499 domain-containing protein [Geomonas anaerohicana]MBJ6750319.1 DUF1499 domain-containing protein [Geomonas anaerohicana]